MKYNESTTIMTRNDTTYLNKDNKIINNNNEEIRYKWYIMMTVLQIYNHTSERFGGLRPLSLSLWLAYDWPLLSLHCKTQTLKLSEQI